MCEDGSEEIAAQRYTLMITRRESDPSIISVKKVNAIVIEHSAQA